MTIQELEVLLYHQFNLKEHPEIAVAEIHDAVIALLSTGLITEVENKDIEYKEYDTTYKGIIHLKQLCDTPLPVQKWMSRDGVLLE